MRQLSPVFQSASREADQQAIRLILQLALTAEERSWVRQMCRDHHYLQQEVHGRARPVAYLVIREEGVVGNDESFYPEKCVRVGFFVYSRMQSSRCLGWYGSSADVAQGKARHTQWEMLVLSRCWLDPRIQQGGDWYIPKAASLLIAQSLTTIGYDYLLLRPVAFPDRPFEIKEVISYCDRSRFNCMLYRFARFKLVRINAQGLCTYQHVLPPLTDAQRQDVLEISRLDKQARQKRLATVLSAQQEVLLFVRFTKRQTA